MKETEEYYNFTDRQKWQHGLNGTPKKNWVKSRNLGAGKKSFYIPIEVQQALADVFFNEFDVVKCEPMVIANEIVCTVTISLLPSYPNSEHRTITGSASKPIQCDSGSSPAKFPLGKKTNALEYNLPAARTAAISNALTTFGNVFGRNLGRSVSAGYNMNEKTKKSKKDE